MPGDYWDEMDLPELAGPFLPVPSDGRPPAPETLEVEGLLVTRLPTGGLALVDSHADGATSMIMLQGPRLEALRSLLRAARNEEAAEASEAAAAEVQESPVEASEVAEPTVEEPAAEEPEPPAAATDGPAPPGVSTREPLVLPRIRAVDGDLRAEPGGDEEPAVDWTACDEQLEAAFLLEQYAMGVPADELPPGWRETLEDLPTTLAARARELRSLFRRMEAGERKPGSGFYGGP